MKRKFTHEEIIVTSVIVTMCASMVYLFGLLVYNVVSSGVNMTI